MKDGFKPPERGRRLICCKCNLVMDDIEPFGTHPEYFHERNGCVNSGWSGTNHERGFKVLLPKSHERARRRGAKAASRHRP